MAVHYQSTDRSAPPHEIPIAGVGTVSLAVCPQYSIAVLSLWRDGENLRREGTVIFWPPDPNRTYVLAGLLFWFDADHNIWWSN